MGSSSICCDYGGHVSIAWMVTIYQHRSEKWEQGVPRCAVPSGMKKSSCLPDIQSVKLMSLKKEKCLSAMLLCQLNVTKVGRVSLCIWQCGRVVEKRRVGHSRWDTGKGDTLLT